MTNNLWTLLSFTNNKASGGWRAAVSSGKRPPKECSVAWKKLLPCVNCQSRVSTINRFARSVHDAPVELSNTNRWNKEYLLQQEHAHCYSSLAAIYNDRILNEVFFQTKHRAREPCLQKHSEVARSMAGLKHCLLRKCSKSVGLHWLYMWPSCCDEAIANSLLLPLVRRAPDWVLWKWCIMTECSTKWQIAYRSILPWQEWREQVSSLQSFSEMSAWESWQYPSYPCIEAYETHIDFCVWSRRAQKCWRQWQLQIYFTVIS